MGKLKVKETKAVIDSVNADLKNPLYLPNFEIIRLLCDISKSLAIIADGINEEDEEEE